MNTCHHCSQPFEITDSDRAFYQKVEVSEPTHCPACRLQRRLAYRNESHLYQRTCDLCQKGVFSLYDMDAPFPVYCTDCWWSDRWDPEAYGRDYDFNRPFFEQFAELLTVVPQACTLQLNNENSEFNSLIAYSKNAYMCAGSYFMEDSYYCRKSQYCRDCMHSHFLDHCELVAYSTNCKNCYSAHHLLNCRNCSASAYLANCSNCKNCFMCSDLNEKEYHFKNQAVGKEEYERLRKEYAQKDPKAVMEEFMAFNQSVPKRNLNLLNCENSTGDYLSSASNAEVCFDSFDIQDSKYLTECVTVKDSMDLTCHDKEIQLCYEMVTGGESNYQSKFGVCSCAGPNNSYCLSTFYLSDSFGCISFHSRKRNCILNKAYSPERYAELKARIVEHMKSTGEWGEFFPIANSTYAYNQTLAQVYFPLTKETALAQGYRWKEEVERGDGPSAALRCEACNKAYRTVPQEKNLAGKIGVESSSKCLECMDRHLLSWKNPRALWPRNCDLCHASMMSSYAPGRLEKVYCGSCYSQMVY
jgi:hypothetical protein